LGTETSDEAVKPSGNISERLEVSSGSILVIDQFMLGNDQFLERLSSDDNIESTVTDFGGCLVSISPGVYRVHRDPEHCFIVLYRIGDEGVESADDKDEPDFAELLSSREQCSAVGQVFVDTRCFVCVDATFLSKKELLEEYRSLRKRRKEKSARDLLREKGATVRYGFRRYGDELGVFKIPDIDGLALWPDVVEQQITESSSVGA